MKCKQCKGTGEDSQFYKTDGLSCIECNGMGELLND